VVIDCIYFLKLIYGHAHPFLATLRSTMEHNEKLTSAPENGSEQVRKLSSSATIGGSSETNLHIDGKVEQKLLLNLDLHIAPIVMLLYLIAFLDRY
jgi:hypothetical protein